jgi:hypothetical protein
MGWRGDHPLLARAVDDLGPSARHRTATRLLDRRDQRPTGPLHYGPPGRVLAVY